ncbi:hypothetical protein BpHYR1_019127 [Brachionus plicatilis]|uniref:Uncharacterized protein n=1 Tax=Brachionus plicatilis TaxID=10195 RepID=A0A3M7RHF5_BRAPC|nr:hypothetical protein BpHYR1_019127 [Brachionus plicatilis]
MAFTLDFDIAIKQHLHVESAFRWNIRHKRNNKIQIVVMIQNIPSELNYFHFKNVLVCSCLGPPVPACLPNINYQDWKNNICEFLEVYLKIESNRKDVIVKRSARLAKKQSWSKVNVMKSKESHFKNLTWLYLTKKSKPVRHRLNNCLSLTIKNKLLRLYLN